MKHHLGIVLQVIVLAVLPVICFWQFQFGFPLIWMPALLVAGMVVFWFGTRLRES